MTELVSQQEFARRRGVSNGTVSRWKGEGRIVMVGKLVDVTASEAMLEQTSGARPDVAARHAEGRPDTDSKRRAIDAGQSYQAARAMREKYAALKAQAEYETLIGNLIARADVDHAMRSIGTAVRAMLDALPDQTAPLVAPVSELHEVHALLTSACRNVLLGLQHAMSMAERELAP